MKNLKLLRLLGLALRTGRLAVGEGRAEDSVRAGRAKLVLLALDAAENTKKKFQDKCAHYRIPLIAPADRYELGACLGRDAVVAAVEDSGFAEQLMKLSGARTACEE